MDGENPSSMDPRDAVHWIAVYQELLEFKAAILGTMNRRLVGMSAPATNELTEIDIRLVEQQQRRYRDRLDFWRQRAPGEADSEEPAV